MVRHNKVPEDFCALSYGSRVVPENVHPLQEYYGEKDVSTVYIVLGRRTLLALSTNDVDHSRSIQVDTDPSHKQHAI